MTTGHRTTFVHLDKTKVVEKAKEMAKYIYDRPWDQLSVSTRRDLLNSASAQLIRLGRFKR